MFVFVFLFVLFVQFISVFFFFFFQAEDGIRDGTVTGVQTCALPISAMRSKTLQEWLSWQEQLHPNAIDLGLDRVTAVLGSLGLSKPAYPILTVGGTRSEERRVGKECRSRWSRSHLKKKIE